MSNYEFYSPVKTISCVNAIENYIGLSAKKLGMHNVLLVTGPVINKLGLADYVEQNLINAGINIGIKYTNIPNDSSVKTIDDICNAYYQNNCNGIVAVGGGSVLDSAKAVKIVLSQNEISLKKFFGYNMSKIGTKIPFIAIPTTCGTGAEVTKVAVISDDDCGTKEEIISEILLPDIAILDPKMLETLPKKNVLLTAFDALSHAIEGYCFKGKNPLSDKYALLAIKNIFEYLPKVLDNESRAEDYLHLLKGACYAGICFSNSMVGGVHAIAHSIGSVLGVGHDFAIASILPYVLKFNLEDCIKEYSHLYAFIKGNKLSCENENAKEFVNLIQNFYLKNVAKVGGVSTLKDCGLNNENSDLIAKITLTDGAILTNPRYMGYNDIIEILASVQENRLW